MNERKPIDPSDLYWSSEKMRDLESEPDWRASPPRLEQIVFKSGLKFEYGSHASSDDQPIIRGILEELGYNRVPLNLDDRENIKNLEEIDVYRFGPKERFVQLTINYDRTY